MSTTALRVRELLREYGWTTKILAEKTGMSESYLTHIKNGTRRWNEDALRKISDAFSKQPAELFVHRGRAVDIMARNAVVEHTKGKEEAIKSVVTVPLVGEIPEHPSKDVNRQLQMATGFSGSFVPSMVTDDDAMFAYVVPGTSMLPRFSKGDCLVIAPSHEVLSGDWAAVEYRTGSKVVRGIMQVSFMDEFIVLDPAGHRGSPVALVRNKDYFRAIGKLIMRHQKL